MLNFLLIFINEVCLLIGMLDFKNNYKISLKFKKEILVIILICSVTLFLHHSIKFHLENL